MKKTTIAGILMLGLCGGAVSIHAQAWQQDNFVISTMCGDPAKSPDTRNHFTNGAASQNTGNFMIDTFNNPVTKYPLPGGTQALSNAQLININRRSFGMAKNAYFNAMADNFYFEKVWNEKVTRSSPQTVWTANGKTFGSINRYDTWVESDYHLWLAKFWGLKTLVSCKLEVTDNRSLNEYGCVTQFAADVSKHFKELDSGRRSAMMGYNISDEPGNNDGHEYQTINTNHWVQEFNKSGNDPTKLKFVNSASWWRVANQSQRDFEQNYTNVNCQNDISMRPEVICMDPYGIWGPDFCTSTPGMAKLLGKYFYNLNLNRTTSLQTARPFWIVFYNIPWDGTAGLDPMNIPDPTESDLRFGIFTPIAYGAKGIMHYSFCDFADRYPSTGFENQGYSALMSHDRITDKTYYGEINFNLFPACAGYTNTETPRSKMAVTTEINRYITNVVGPVIMTSDNLGVYHKAKTFTGYDISDCGGNPVKVESFSTSTEQNLPQPSATVSLLNDLNDANLMAGVFRDKRDPTTQYILVVNKNCLNRTNNGNKLAQCLVNLNGSYNGSYTGKVFLSPRCNNYNGATAFNLASTTVNSNKTCVTVGPLEGGEGRLIKVTGVGTAGTKPGFRPQGEIAAINNAGKVFCFARGTDNNLWYRQQENANNDYWGSKWTSLGGGTINGNLVCGFPSKTDRRLFVFTINSSNQLVCTWQSDPTNNVWQSWYAPTLDNLDPNSKICATVYGANQNQLLLFANNTNHVLRGCFYNGSSWTTMGTSSGPIGNYIAAGFNPGNKTTDVFITSKTSTQLYRARVDVNGTFGAFTALLKDNGSPMTSTSEITVGINADYGNNSLEAVVASGGQLWHSWQTTAGGTWSPFALLTNDAKEVPPDATASVSFGNNKDGYIELFARGGDKFIKNIYRDWWSPGADKCNYWSCHLTNLGNFGNASVTGGATHIAVANYQDGREVVFATGDGNANVFYTSQVRDPSIGDWQVFVPFTNNY